MSHRIHLPAILVLGALLIAWLLSSYTARPLQSSKDKLFQQIDVEVDKAQRMLASYNPSLTRMGHQMGAAGGKPAEELADRWQEFLNPAEPQDNALQTTLRTQQQGLHKLNDAFSSLAGKPAETAQPAGNPVEAYLGLNANIQRNNKVINDALAVLQNAINLSEGDLSGADHLSATRLEAVLCYHQADMLRRQAALHRADSEEAQRTLVDWAGEWSRWQQQAASLGVALSATQPSSTDGDTPVVMALPQRIEALEARKVEVATEQQAAEKTAAQLSDMIEEISARAQAAEENARRAREHMAGLQTAGVDSSDPAAVRRFFDDYNQSAAVERKDAREFSILDQGALRHARVQDDEDDAVLSGPVVPIKDDEQIQTERGLTALKSDLAAVEAVIEGFKGVTAQIDREIEQCKSRTSALESRIAATQQQQQHIASEAVQVVKQAMAAGAEAQRLEVEAIEFLASRGTQAAQRARRAAEKRISEAREQNAQSNPESPNARLVMISDDNNTVGLATTLAGDMSFMTAMIQRQQAEGLIVQQKLLEACRTLGLTIDANALPDGVALDTNSTLLNADNAASEAEKLRAAAAESAQAALETYQQADGPLRQLWVLHAQMAAVHYFLANLTADETAAAHRAEALSEYKRALAGREDRPEAKVYGPITAELAEK